tara:strand:+ start:1603 stop:2019 length:417 start_codon:yes stop_codon:yes gene_type:complete
MTERPTWEKYFNELTQLTAKRSPCKKLQVGCILVRDNRIIAQGYNGYLPGAVHEQKIRDGHEIATVHAEQNAIADCAKRGVSCNKTTAYITHYPCVNCMKILCAAGINEIKYTNDYNNDELIQYFAEQSKVKVTKLSI